MCLFSSNRCFAIFAVAFTVAAGVIVSFPRIAIAQGFLQSTWQAAEGHDMASAGDVDGDGYDDVIIVQKNELRLFHGSPTGLSSNAAWKKSGNYAQSGTLEHLSVDGAGDVNGDGYDDVIVGDPYVNGPSPTDAKVDLYLGSPSGLNQSPSWTLFRQGSNQDPTGLGYQVAHAGDIDADGYADVVITDPGVSTRPSLPGQCPEGKVHVFYGSESGFSDSADWTYTFTPNSGTPGSCIGLNAVGGGDVNGDGFADIAFVARSVSNPMPKGAGRLYVFHGSGSGLKSNPNFTSNHPRSRIVGAGEGLYGLDLSFGDVNGDGVSDLMVTGAGQYADLNPEKNFTRDFLYVGSQTGLQQSLAWTHHKPGTWSQTIKGDADGDGFSDVLTSTVQQREARLVMYHGSASGVLEPRAWFFGEDPVVTVHATSEEHTPSFAGDVNADGFDDYLITYEKGTSTATHLHRGGPNPSPTAQETSIRVTPGQSVDVTLEASDPFGDPLTYSVVDSPEHGSTNNVDADAGELIYEPDDGYTGDDAFTFEAADPYGNSDEATVSLSVRLENRPPEFVAPTPSGTLEVEAGQELQFSVAADDPDGDTLEYSIRPVPDGASVSADGTSFTWRPDGDQVGIYEIRLTVDDGTTTAERTVKIRVRAAQPDPDTGMADATDGDVGPDAGTDAATSSPSGGEGTDTSGCGCRSNGSSGMPGAAVVLLLTAIFIGRSEELRIGRAD